MLDRLILGKLGNKALAERAARKFRERGNDQPENLEAVDIRRRRLLLLPLAIPIALVHTIFLVMNLAILLLRYVTLEDHSRFAALRQKWDKLADHWGKYPACFIYKAVELALYDQYALRSQGSTLEIGVYTGETARAFFLGKRLDVGVEYNIERFLTYKHDGQIHDRLYSADIRNLPFVDGVFGAVYCVHSIDDMELPAEDALSEIGRVLRPGGVVHFSGLTKNFMSHNLLIRALRAMGLRRAGDFVFKLVYVGSFNHHERDEWKGILRNCGLELTEYRTYVPLNFAGLFDLAYRPETVLVNLCGWKQWLAPLAATRWFRNVLYMAAGAMFALSERQIENREGINFFASARKPSNGGSDRLFAPAKDLRCPHCTTLLAAHEQKPSENLECGNCGASYPVVEGIPVLLDLPPAT